jgi:hypothetical protein
MKKLMEKLFLTMSVAVSILFFTSAYAADINLKPVNLFDGKIVLQVPENFKLMSPDMLKQKYPSEQRPTTVYSNEDGSINLAVNYTPHQLGENDLQQALTVLEEAITKSFPQATWYDKEVTSINGKKFAVVEVKTPARDGNIYNLMFFTSLNDKMLLFSFNCTEQEQNVWAPIAKRIRDSVKIGA